MAQASTLPGAPAVEPAAGLYDARRGVRYAKPLFRGWMHLVMFEASLVIGTLTLLAVHGGSRIASVAVYVSCVSGLFGVSALYHRGNWGPTASGVLQRLDHAMIFLLIAGTATPGFTVGAPGGWGTLGLVLIWALTLAALTTHLVWMHAPERLVGATFVALGCVAGLALPAVWISGGTAAGVLMLTGGALYIAGALSYHRRKPDPLPAVFGYHEVFHTYVSAAATCHYIAIVLLLR